MEAMVASFVDRAGLIAGAIAKVLMPGRDPGGCIITIIIGIVGALLGGFLATPLGYGGLGLRLAEPGDRRPRIDHPPGSVRMFSKGRRR